MVEMLAPVLGIDVSQKTLDVTLLTDKGGKRRKRFANTPEGINKVEEWLQKQTKEVVHVSMESTSVYWEEVAEALHEAGHRVSVVNPVRIKGYAMSQLRRSKTDPLDGDVIADFCRTQRPEEWTPPTKEQKKLRALVRHLEALKKSRTQQMNRLDTFRDEEVKTSLETLLSVIEREIEAVTKRIDEFMDQHPDLKEKNNSWNLSKGLAARRQSIFWLKCMTWTVTSMPKQWPPMQVLPRLIISQGLQCDDVLKSRGWGKPACALLCIFRLSRPSNTTPLCKKWPND